MLPGTQIIDRYLGRQIALATVIGVAVLSFVLVLGNLFKEVFELMVEKGLEVWAVLAFVAHILPFSLIFTIPWGLLTAVLLVFGRLSADNELVSLRMAGMSLWRICRPVFVIALALSILSYWINTSIAPSSQAKMKSAMFDMVANDPLSLFVANEPITEFPGYEIFAKEREGNLLRDVGIVMIHDEVKMATMTIHARSAEVSYNDAESKLDLKLYETNQIVRDAAAPEDEESERWASMSKEEKLKESLNNIEGYTSGHEAGVLNVSIDLTELRDKARRVTPSTLSSKELARRIAEDDTLSDSKRSMMRTEIHKRFSFSMACLTFVLIGIPLGVTAQRRETSVGFLLSLVIAIVYFLFIIIADTFRDKPGAMPHLLMWVPNVIFIALGLVLFLRLSRK